MAIVLLATLSASHTASCLVRHDVFGCQPSGYLPGRSGDCETSNSPDCCVDGKQYPQFLCSPPVPATTWVVLTVNGFSKGKDGGLPSECDSAYHDDSEMVVVLSTGWFSGMSCCIRNIKITAKGGSSVYAKVVDKCDSRLRRRAQVQGAMRLQRPGRLAGGVGCPGPRSEHRFAGCYLI
uniref:Ripening-related protein 2 n=1 Tax=Aegilops tauschii TaxID=37682 RepID=M8AWI3_AEGTA